MSDETERGTARGLVEFLAFAGGKGLLKARTAEAYKSAASRILSIDGEDWMDTDLRSLDLDMQVDRFVRLEGTKFKPETLNTYKSRFRSAVTEYLRYIEDPMAYRGPVPQQRSDKPRRPSRTRSTRQPVAAAETPKATHRDDDRRSGEESGGRSSLVKYPFPLRSGQMAYFELPRDLSRTEAQRMAAFIGSLAIDDLPELMPGREREP